MPDSNDHDWHWGNQMLACFDDLRESFAERDPPIVDREVIPPFCGKPDDMFIWLICEHHDDVSRMSDDADALASLLRSRMTSRGFPESAVDTVGVSFTSLQDIEAGGGRFYFFR